jgi:hypothetical protein
MSESIANSIADQISVFHSAAKTASDLHLKSQQFGHLGADADFALGMAAYTLRNYQQAHDLLCSSYLANNNVETAIRIAMTDLRRGDFECAIKWSQVAISAAPDGVFTTYVSNSKVPYFSVLAAGEFGAGNLKAATEAAKVALGMVETDAMAAQVLMLSNIISGDASSALNLAKGFPAFDLEEHPMKQFLKLAQGAASANADGVPLHLSGMKTFGMNMRE